MGSPEKATPNGRTRGIVAATASADVGGGKPSGGSISTPTGGRAEIPRVMKKGGRPSEKKWWSCATMALTIIRFLFVVCPILLPLRWVQLLIQACSSRAEAKCMERWCLDRINSAESFHTWLSTMALLDDHRGIQAWRAKLPDKEDCDAEGLAQDGLHARTLVLSQNEHAMGEFLHSRLHREAHGITNRGNYQYSTGTLRCVEDYNDAMMRLIQAFGGSLESEALTQQTPSCGETCDGKVWRAGRNTPTDVQSSTGLSLESAEFGNCKKCGEGIKSMYDNTKVAGVEVEEEERGGGGQERNVGRAASPSRSSVPMPHYCTDPSHVLQCSHKPHAACETHFTDVERMKLLQDTLRSHGRSALMLSGGYTLGICHVGVARALFEAGLLPDIVSGSSTGSIIAAMICTKTEDELYEALVHSARSVEKIYFAPFHNGGILQKLKRLLQGKSFMDVRILMESLRNTLGDITFAEAFHKTGRTLNVCVTNDHYNDTHMSQQMLLNYLTAPNVLLWSAVSASCAPPGLFTAVQLIEKLPGRSFRRFLPGQLWCDKFVSLDLPHESLAAMFNVNYFIVSQVKPHIIPFVQSPTSLLMHKQRRLKRLLNYFWYGSSRAVRHWILKLFDSGLVSKTGRWEVLHTMLAQNHDGEMLILPFENVLHAVRNYVNIMSNPGHEHIGDLIKMAQRRTWPHLNQLHHITAVERVLVREIALLKQKVDANSGREMVWAT